MDKKVLGGIGVVAVLVIGFLAYKAMSLRSEAAKWTGPMKEIVEEEIKHDGTVTHSRYVSLIDAPVDAVQKAIWAVEDSPQTVENIKMAKVLESKDNTKLVEINLQALTLPLQNFTMLWTLYPDQHRITFKTVKSQAQDIEAEYKLEPSPDGKRTRLTYTTTSKDKIAVPFPQSVLDSANRETYVNTVRGIQKTVKAQG
ncbi:MAG TPA: hypothetical protein VMW56_16890 [Candidatus Margulisiibacteriota bacterium]|nr:hypothetical protein [Candidatus Margulisiibacteriota bacterium]